jgi:uncharacterized lipoprotein NlpE involved in copper resistance
MQIDLRQILSAILVGLTIYGCNNMNDRNKITQEEIKQALGDVTDKDLIPHYKTVYTADSVELVNLDTLLSQDNIDHWTCLTILANSCKELKADFNNYLLDSYGTVEVTDDRLTYPDIGNIAHFIIWKYKSNETNCFDRIFKSAEIILKKGDDNAQNLIIVGLFEGIQNVGGWHKVDYYKGFDKWLQPESKQSWDVLIEAWEGKKNK